MASNKKVTEGKEAPGAFAPKFAQLNDDVLERYGCGRNGFPRAAAA